MAKLINLPEMVYDTNANEDHWFVKTIHLEAHFDPTIEKIVAYDHFVENYDEYIDPLQLRVNALEAELKALKEKHKQPRKTRRKLTAGEQREVRELIIKGEGNTPIATEYDCSDSAISRYRIEMRKEGLDV